MFIFILIFVLVLMLILLLFFIFIFRLWGEVTGAKAANPKICPGLESQ
jgi:hypothetical protein